MLTINDVARVLRVSAQTVRRMIANGRLPSTRAQNRVLIAPASVLAVAPGLTIEDIDRIVKRKDALP